MSARYRVWNQVQDDLLAECLTVPSRISLGPYGLPWQTVAQSMNEKMASRGLTYYPFSYLSCSKRYNKFIIFTLGTENYNLDTCGAKMPPWRIAEFELLRNFIPNSMPGGKSASPDHAILQYGIRSNTEANWNNVARDMNSQGHWQRNYIPKAVETAYRLRIFPKFSQPQAPVSPVPQGEALLALANAALMIQEPAVGAAAVAKLDVAALREHVFHVYDVDYMANVWLLMSLQVSDGSEDTSSEDDDDIVSPEGQTPFGSPGKLVFRHYEPNQ